MYPRDCFPELVRHTLYRPLLIGTPASVSQSQPVARFGNNLTRRPSGFALPNFGDTRDMVFTQGLPLGGR